MDMHAHGIVRTDAIKAKSIAVSINLIVVPIAATNDIPATSAKMK
jgi:hypothetical protein